jgi:hypothetical protein
MSTTVITECISWLIKLIDNNDARWKPEIRTGQCFEVSFLLHMIQTYAK